MIWWIDRWRKSTAFTDMTLEQQAAYRNLIDECWLRNGAIPNNQRVLARACGDSDRWPDVQQVVMQRFYLNGDGAWHNVTVDTLMSRTTRSAVRQQRHRGRRKSA